MGGVIAYLLPAMAQTRTIAAVDPATGARLTRRTARTYVAVVVVGDPAQGKAVAATWCGRPDLAEKALRKFSRPDARLAPVVEDPWADAEPAQAEPAPAPVAGCRLAGDARHLFALFARRYSLTAPQVFALQSEVLGWASRSPAFWVAGQPLAGPFGALTAGLARRGVISVDGIRRTWAPDVLAELWAVAQAQAEAEGLPPVPALADAAPQPALPSEARRGAAAEPLAQVEVDPYRRGEWQRTGIGPEPVAVAERRAARWAERNPEHCYRVVPVAPRPVLPGEAEPPAPVAQDGPAPELPRLRADAAAGRPVSLAALARALADDLATPAPTPDSLRARAAVRSAEAERVADAEPARAQAAADQASTLTAWADSLSPSPVADAWAGQPWDPGTPDARARVALQGERVATLWPIAQAVRGAGFDLPPIWWADGPILAGERTYGEALAALPLGAIAAAAAALAALPPVTAAQDRALRLCRGEAVGV